MKNYDLNSLNQQQLEALYCNSGAVLVTAGAGSGKTTVIVNRIANIIKFGNAYESDYIPENIGDNDYEILKAYLDSGDEFLK